MTDRLEQITHKIYTEGVVKAREEARLIIAEATSKAAEIEKEAGKKATEIIRKAKQDADEITKKTEVELQLAANQFTSTLKQKINRLITAKQTENQLHDAFNDLAFIKKMILIILQNWKHNGTDDLQIILPEENRKELDTFFDAKALEAINKSVELSFDPQIGSGFRIEPKNGTYFISFTDADFVNYFKKYLKKRTHNLLFGSVEQNNDNILEKSGDKHLESD